MKHLIYVLFSVLLLSLALPAPARNGEPVIRELDHVLAVVNDDVITKLELDQRVRRVKKQLAQNRRNLPPENILRRQILESMILEKLQLQIARKAGIRVDDETVNRVINNIAQENGLSMQQFQQVLSKDGYSFAEFRDNIRNEIIINQLRKRRIESSVTVTEQEVDNYLANLDSRKGLNDEFHLGHILIGLPEGATPDQIQAAQDKAQQVFNRLSLGADFHQTAIAESSGQNALNGGDLGWRKGAQLPSGFAELVVDMQPGDISEPIRSSGGFHIIKLIDRRSSSRRHIVTQTLARHILIKPNQVVSDTEARQRLLRLRERILNGEDFGALARAHSDDTVSAAEGGSLGWFSPGSMVPRFEEEVKKLQSGQLSKPFQSRFGWHIVQVMSRRKHDDTQKYERLQARQAIHKRKSEEALEEWLRRLRSEAYVEYRMNQ